MSEHDEQAALIQWADTHPDKRLRLLYAIPNAGKRSYGAAAYYKAEGLRPGVPDLCLPVPAYGWHGLYIELKHGENKPTQKQLEWLDALSGQGYFCAVCWGWEEGSKTIEGYLGLLRANR